MKRGCRKRRLTVVQRGRSDRRRPILERHCPGRHWSGGCRNACCEGDGGTESRRILAWDYFRNSCGGFHRDTEAMSRFGVPGNVFAEILQRVHSCCCDGNRPCIRNGGAVVQRVEPGCDPATRIGGAERYLGLRNEGASTCSTCNRRLGCGRHRVVAERAVTE